MNFPARSLFLFCLCSAQVFAADAKPGADTLNRWVGGKWVGAGQFADTDYSKANKASAVTTCAWSPDHIFVICDQDINFGGQPMRDLSIYASDAKSGKFYFYGISLGQEKPRSTALDISANGERWIYSSAADIKGKIRAVPHHQPVPRQRSCRLVVGIFRRQREDVDEDRRRQGIAPVKPWQPYREHVRITCRRLILSC